MYPKYIIGVILSGAQWNIFQGLLKKMGLIIPVSLWLNKAWVLRFSKVNNYNATPHDVFFSSNKFLINFFKALVIVNY